MREAATEELKRKVLAYLQTVSKAKNRDISNALKEEKAAVDRAVNELSKEDKVEFIYLGTSYVKLKEG